MKLEARSGRWAAAVVHLGLGAVLLSGCEEKKPNLASAASSIASAPVPSGAMTKPFVIDNESNTSMELEAPKGTVKAKTTGATGTLDVDPTNLATSRGVVKMDLATLTTNSFVGKTPKEEKDAERDNKAQTTHARTWLEVGDGEKAKLDEKVKEANRYAVYSIRSIENPSATDLGKVTPTKDDGDELRTVTLTTKGELLVHGHATEREADVEVIFRYDAGGNADNPKAILIKTRKPFRVTLRDHDVKPRDATGQIAKESFWLIGTKVAETAAITLDLRARPK